MSKTRFTPWIVLACIGTLAGCTSGEGGTAGNTELNVVIPNGSGNGSAVPAELDIQVVEYTINCEGAPTSGFPGIDEIETTFDPDVQINGVLEVLDTASGGPIPADFGDTLDEAYVWQGFMDIPLEADCTVQLRARDADEEVICSATTVFDTNSIPAGGTVKVNVLMQCGLSFQAPVGMLDLDGDFQFNIANFCPSLYALNCLDSELNVRTVDSPLGGTVDVLATSCQVRFDDGDSGCGTACDDQCCQQALDGSGLECFYPGGPDPTESVPGTSQCPPTDPAPVLTTTVTCVSGLGACVIDCDGIPNGTIPGSDPTPDSECVYTGDTLGNPGDPAPSAGVPGDGGFFVFCLTTVNSDGETVPATPGDDIICTAVTNDGDDDCEKEKEVPLTIIGASACDDFGGDAACDLAIGDDCNPGICVDAGCLGTEASCCDTEFADAGDSCDPGTGGGGECDGAGTCDPTTCTEDADCELDGNVCTVPADGTCQPSQTPDCTLPEEAGNFGGTCDTGTGSGDGSCGAENATDEGTCVSNDVCTADGQAQCELDGNVCTAPTCDLTATPYACGTESAEGAEGDDCTTTGGDAGTCQSGSCEAPNEAPQTTVYDIQCLTALSPNPFVLALNITADPDGVFTDESPQVSINMTTNGEVVLTEAVVVGLLDSGVLTGPPFIATINEGFINALIVNAQLGTCPACGGNVAPMAMASTPYDVNLEDDPDGNTIPGPLVVPTIFFGGPYTPDVGATSVDIDLDSWELSVSANTSFGPLTLVFPTLACSALTETPINIASFPVN